jgi:site-specific DNA-cytosine methylase
MENVPDVMTAGAEILAGVIRLLESNYLVRVAVLAARDFGVPQRRHRAFLVGVRRDVADHLRMTQSDDLIPIFPQPNSHAVSIREALTGLAQSAEDVLPFVTSARTTGLGALISKLPKEPSRHTRLRHVSPGETKHFTLVRTSWDLPAPTLTASGQKPNGLTGVVHPICDRKFTIPELKRLTSLPDDFALTGTLSQAAERICRMVPPFLTAAIAHSIYWNILEPFRRSQ